MTFAIAACALGGLACVRPAARDPGVNVPAGVSAAAPAPAPPADDPLAGCKPAELPPARLWRLTQTQLRNSLQDLFGFAGMAIESLPAESRLEGYDNGAERLGVPPALMDRYATVSEEIASEAVRRSATLLPCPIDQLGTAGGCLREFLGKFGQRVWRRPLGDAEVARLADVYTTSAAASNPEQGLRNLIKALLLSPNFLFRSELGEPSPGDGPVRLTDFELASALSFVLWDTTPDETLLELAAAGRLRDPAVLRAQAQRLLGDARRSAPMFTAFVRQWLKVDDLPRLRKDRKLFPMYGSSVASDLLEENRRFVESVVFDPGGDRQLRTLLTAPYGYINARTAAVYGVPAPEAPKGAAATALEGPEANLVTEAMTLRQRPLDPAQRRGIFTHGAFLAAHASSDEPKLVARGSLVREQLLCGEVPEPPDEFKFDESKITDDMTAREKFVLHTRSAFCARCHALFDGIGFALESYDAIGRFRQTDKNKPIDPSGSLTVPHSGEIKFANFVELTEKLADLPEAQDCFSLQLLTFATGRSPKEVPACEARALARSFAASGHRLDALLLSVVTAPSFSLRSPAP